MSRRLLLPLLLLPLLGGCDLLGIESASQVAERKTAEGKAVGGACRHAGRAIEDCYTLNRRTDKAAIYAGWREMDDYMRENKLAPVAPVLPPEGRGKVAEGGGDATEEGAAEKTAKADGKEKADKADKAGSGEKPARPGHADKSHAGTKAVDKADAHPSGAEDKSSGSSPAHSDVAAAH